LLADVWFCEHCIPRLIEQLAEEGVRLLADVWFCEHCIPRLIEQLAEEGVRLLPDVYGSLPLLGEGLGMGFILLILVIWFRIVNSSSAQ
jgi:hypothetical protein